MTLDGSILPSKLPDPPRRVVRRDAGCILAVAYGIIVLFCLLALAPAAYSVVALMYALGGTETTGETTGFSEGSKTRSVDFEYRVNGEKRTDYERVSVEVLVAQKAKHEAGDKTVKVRYLHAGPVKIAGLPELSSVWWVPGRAFLLLGIAGAIVWFLLWAAFKWPQKEKLLVANGIATVGAITGKRTQHLHRGELYLAQYLYTGPSGAQWTAEAVVRGKRRLEAIPIGEVVTVLVDPKDEKQSTVYEYSLFKVREGT